MRDDLKTTQEIEADELIEEMKTELHAVPVKPACTPEAHAQVIHTDHVLLRWGIWQIRRTRDKELAGSAKIKIGPLQVSGLAAAQVGVILWRLTLLGIILTILLHQMGIKVQLREMLGLPSNGKTAMTEKVTP